MHCLYQKDHAIDAHTGYPTLDGLVNFYSDGVHEHGFFMATLRAVDFCLKGASHKYHINRHIKPSMDEIYKLPKQLLAQHTSMSHNI